MRKTLTLNLVMISSFFYSFTPRYFFGDKNFKIINTLIDSENIGTNVEIFI